jgi:hypothetical protein
MLVGATQCTNLRFYRWGFFNIVLLENSAKTCMAARGPCCYRALAAGCCAAAFVRGSPRPRPSWSPLTLEAAELLANPRSIYAHLAHSWLDLPGMGARPRPSTTVNHCHRSRRVTAGWPLSQLARLHWPTRTVCCRSISPLPPPASTRPAGSPSPTLCPAQAGRSSMRRMRASKLCMGCAGPTRRRSYLRSTA